MDELRRRLDGEQEEALKYWTLLWWWCLFQCKIQLRNNGSVYFNIKTSPPRSFSAKKMPHGHRTERKTSSDFDRGSHQKVAEREFFIGVSKNKSKRKFRRALPSNNKQNTIYLDHALWVRILQHNEIEGDPFGHNSFLLFF